MSLLRRFPTSQGYACCTYCRHTRTAQGGGRSFQDRNLIGELLCFVDGGANWWTEGCLTHVNTCSLSVLHPRPLRTPAPFFNRDGRRVLEKKGFPPILKKPLLWGTCPARKKSTLGRRTSRVTLSLKNEHALARHPKVTALPQWRNHLFMHPLEEYVVGVRERGADRRGEKCSSSWAREERR